MKPSKTANSTITVMTIDSTPCPKKREMVVAPSRIRMRIFLNCSSKISKRISALEILLEQFKNILILILLGATTISLFLGHGVESIVITVIVLFAVLLGFIQEYRAERAIEALQKMAAPTASVLRDGNEVEVPAGDLGAG